MEFIFIQTPQFLLCSLEILNFKLSSFSVYFTFIFILCLSCSTGPMMAITFEQSATQFGRSKLKVEIRCQHDESSYYYMYWYSQPKTKGALVLIGYIYNLEAPNYEPNFQPRFKMTREALQKGNLTISDLKPEDSGIYYCAASMHSAAQGLLSMFKM
ncbi:VPREB protein, partial [Amia calva]|nr:VPREB protein [Amia calva]